MSTVNDTIHDLIIDFLHGNLSESGKVDLNSWINESTGNKELFERLTNTESVSGELGKLYSYPGEKGWERIERNFSFETHHQVQDDKNIEKSILNQAWSRIWKKIAAAAAVLILVVSSYFLVFNKTDKKSDLVKTNDTLHQDVQAPKNSKAMIVLSDGRKVLLDNVTIGTVAMQNEVKVEKNRNGEIVYTGNSNEVEYNTLFNPRGSKTVNLTLVDGTKVWMNTESSLTYFTSVGNGDRRVEITGECYFEVAHNALKPFIVKDVIRGTEIQVLGTHFNVNSYADEYGMKITLMEGSVRVMKGTSKSILKPGEQAQIVNEIKIINSVDMDEVMAWKNDRFQFNKASLQEVMRQIARWYDVEISYEGKITSQKFGGKMQRDLNLSEVLDGLEKIQVHFRIEGKKVVVMP